MNVYCIAIGGITSQYQWRCSEYDSRNDRRYVPVSTEGTRLDIAMNNVSYVNSSPNQTYIFSTFPGLDCNGTVTAIEYCYSGIQSTTEPSTWPVFKFFYTG